MSRECKHHINHLILSIHLVSGLRSLDYAAGETTIVFHARQAGGLTNSTAVTADGTKSSSSGTAVISGAHVGSKSEADITIRPSVHTEMTLEHMLISE